MQSFAVLLRSELSCYNSQIGMNISLIFYFLIPAITCIPRQAVRTEVRARRGAQPPSFQECMEGCGMRVDCMNVPILFALNTDYSEGYSKNVICINPSPSPSQPQSYLLKGCPDKFFDPGQDPRGICSITSENGTDLQLKAKELVSGLHPLDCWNDRNNSIIPISAIVANESIPYRDLLIYINGVFQHDYHNATKVTIDFKDNLTLVVRGVGNISKINLTSESRFICKTGYVCKLGRSDTPNRYLECSLNTPAELSDNGTTLTFFVDNREEIKINIFVNGSSPVASGSAIKPTAATSVPTTSLSLSKVLSSYVSETVLATSFSDKDSEHMPKGVIIGVTTAIASLLVVGIIACLLWMRSHVRKKKSHENTLKSTEEASAVASAPPIFSSSTSSLRSTVTPVDRQPPVISLSNTLDRRLRGIDGKLDKFDDKLDKVDEKVEGVNTSINAIMKDNVKSLKRQNSAS